MRESINQIMTKDDLSMLISLINVGIKNYNNAENFIKVFRRDDRLFKNRDNTIISYINDEINVNFRSNNFNSRIIELNSGYFESIIYNNKIEIVFKLFSNHNVTKSYSQKYSFNNLIYCFIDYNRKKISFEKEENGKFNVLFKTEI